MTPASLRTSDLLPTASALALVVLGACGPGVELGALDVETASRGVGTYAEVTGFGSNPGGLKAYAYVPSPAPSAGAPLVLALHACSQTANDYQKAGWNTLADEWGFYVLYPEQQANNNPLRCFNWAGEYSDPTNLRRGEGENQSIIQMIDKMAADHGIDRSRVFITGHSGGAAQSALMLATWPEVFAAAGLIAGIPYNCTTSYNEVTTCLSPGIDRTPQQWGDRARAGRTGYSGPYPRVSVWHGTSDSTVNPRNANELVEQWTNVHGIDVTPDASDMLDGFPRSRFQDGQGATKVELVQITNMNHGTPVVPSEGCGSTGAYFLDAGICASRRLGEFFGLDGAAPGDTQPPVVNLTAPVDGAMLSGVVSVQVSATDDVGVTRVEVYVDGGLLTTLSSAPYSYSWDTGAEANGSHQLRAVAFDAAGNSATDDDTTVTIQGGVNDTTAPSVNITTPASGASVSGAVTISAEASDDFGVARVEVFVDGVKLGESTVPPYSVQWDTAGVAEGAHRLSATAHDSAGNTRTDDDTSVTVTRAAMGDTTPPVVSFTQPVQGDSVSGLIRVQLEATDEGGVKTGLLFLGDMQIGADYRSPFEFLWDTATFPEGQQHLVARVFDEAGNVGLAEIDVTVTRSEEPGEEQPVVVGRKYWGCSTTGATPADGLALYLSLVAAAAVLGRRARRDDDQE